MQLLTMRRSESPVPFFKRSLPVPPRRALAPPRVEDPALPRDIASRFGRRVRELRHARQMTQSEVAAHFGIDRTFLSDVERGRKSVCLPTMEVLALGFGVSLSDLMRGI